MTRPIVDPSVMIAPGGIHLQEDGSKIAVVVAAQPYLRGLNLQPIEKGGLCHS